MRPALDWQTSTQIDQAHDILYDFAVLSRSSLLFHRKQMRFINAARSLSFEIEGKMGKEKTLSGRLAPELVSSS
jgi:hypothetical protein